MDFDNIPFKTLFPETELALSAVIKASKEVLKVYNKDFSSTLKDDKEPVTEADIKSNKILIDTLSKAGYPIISEESKDFEGLKHDKTWIIDPLDGTSDFINKTDEFSVMISFVKNHTPIIGIVYQPTNDILYVAQDGCGAYQCIKKKWCKLSVNNQTHINECRAVVSRHHLGDQEKKFIGLLKISSFIQKGSCGLKVADICKGDAELYFAITNKIKQWDTCAAYCLIKEAGGKMTDMFGNDLKYNLGALNHQNGILVTNGVIHASIVKKYGEFLKKG